jgi:hypothetical protein
LAEVVRAEVGDLMLLEVAPDVFGRIEFGGIGGKEMKFEATGLLGGKIADRATVMDAQTIPDNQQIAGDVAQQVPQKLDGLRGANRAGEKLEVEPEPGDAGHRRQGLPSKVILQDRRLAARRPGPGAMGPFAQSAFVDKDDGFALFPGFFFNAGQVTRFQCRMALSSRSSARPVGRWQLQPN